MSSTSKNKKEDERPRLERRRSNSEPPRLRGRRSDADSNSDSGGARSMSRSRSRSRDREPRRRRSGSNDDGRLAHNSPLLADELPKLGGMARAAATEWGLDESRLLAWAAARRLPGIGVADVSQYRRENPDEDLSAEMGGDLLGC